MLEKEHLKHSAPDRDGLVIYGHLYNAQSAAYIIINNITEQWADLIVGGCRDRF